MTWHTGGYALHGWYPTGDALLVEATRDHSWTQASRLMRVETHGRKAPSLLFDDYGGEASIDADGERVLFVREGRRWWRKGYVGPAAGQIWMHDARTDDFALLIDDDAEARWPLWAPDGGRFYYVSGRSGSMNLWERTLAGGADRQLTHHADDSVVSPALSRDGKTIVYRHLFDLYRLRLNQDVGPERIEIHDRGEGVSETARRTADRATEVAFTSDGLEVAFIADGDLWVMDTELREPINVTDTPESESSPVFAGDDSALYYVSDAGGQSDVWRAEPASSDSYWWQNDDFMRTRLTDDTDVESALTVSPDGGPVAYVKGLGDLVLHDADTGDARVLAESWNAPDYDWSPDGRWIAYAVDDADYNRDIWLAPVDASTPAYNVSRHPDSESDPVWSPDGKLLAFTGERAHAESDIYYVWLSEEDEDRTDRDRAVVKAVGKLDKARKKAKAEPAAPADTPAADATGAADVSEPDDGDGEDATDEPETDDPPDVHIDFDRIHERIRRVTIADTDENGLFWSRDSKKLAFQATVNGKKGTYTIEIPEELGPKLLSEKTGAQARWLEEDDTIVWLSDGVPGALTAKGDATPYSFEVRTVVDRAARYGAGFDLAWRTMRDRYYDARLGSRDWDAIRAKYRAVAGACGTDEEFTQVAQLMLGELNGSHLGFSASDADRWKTSDAWRDVTAHLGIRFDPAHTGDGLRARDVLPDGPADRHGSRVAAGETVVSIDGSPVDASMDLTTVLNGPLERDVRLVVRDADGEERDVVIRPITHRAARGLLYTKWVMDNEAAVHEMSNEAVGYLHVRGMNWPSFQEFERQLYAAGAGRDGLIIDVRYNGGGYTTDHLLTALTQPTHATTVGRGGEPGYPQGRRVYATWDRPIVVLCNQRSFSNAEIFSHAIKTLGRGRLVGVQTGGGVISTGSREILDIGRLRIPGRGWFLPDGEDMELNGAVPDIVIWPEPGEMPAGIDRQLEAAVAALAEDVAAWRERSKATPRTAAERRE
ncbi:hypothetical protein HN937_01395, partial [Candidatus Poribacteria bacterium]|nr:hypothetical protein [Candidatus Poribacteria bacterium]